MTSLRQIEANRRNERKQRSRRNAVRHGLAAETVIGVSEDTDRGGNYICIR